MLEQIKASAGSGKTYTLTRRFLTLLRKATEDGGAFSCSYSTTPFTTYPLGGIIAATFTNKAATEMKSRVIRELKEMALATDDPLEKNTPLFRPAEAERWIQSILRRYDALNIRTIDSLLTLLVRLNVLSLDLPPDFTPSFDDDAYFTPLYDALMDSAANGGGEHIEAIRKACRGLVLYGGIKGFAPAGNLRNRLQDVVHFILGSATPLPDAASFQHIRERQLALRQQLIRHAESLCRHIVAEELQTKKYFLPFVESCRDCPPWGMPNKSEYANKASLGECVLKASANAYSDQADFAFSALTDAYTKLVRYDALYRTSLELEPFLQLAEPLTALMQAQMQEDGCVPANLLPALALRAVSGEYGVSDAFCRMGNAIAHLLFDEFQDTSRDQWASVHPLVEESLSRGGSLTYVGDIKQAIYSWRGGDAALFDDVLRDTGLTVMLHEAPLQTSLDTNWRSAPAIVTHNNTVFSRLAEPATAKAILEALLPEDTPDALMCEAATTLTHTFTGTTQNIAPRNAHASGLVRLTRMTENNSEDLYTRVQETLQTLFLEDLLPRRSPGDIAVLVRSNTEAAQVAAWLTQWRCPVVTEHSFSLNAHPLVQRLLSLLAFLEYPLDDTSFWAFVTSPECFLPVSGLCHEDMTDWLARQGGKKKTEALYLAFRRDFPEAWSHHLAPFHDQAGLMSAYDTIAEAIRHFRLLIVDDAHEQATENPHAPFLRRFMELAYAAEGKGHSSLSAFLEFWEESGVNEKVPMPEHMDAVHIVTMHKAKGLEFPVVVVPFQHHVDPALQNRTASAPITIAEVEGQNILTRLIAQTGEPYYKARVRTAIENLNLLYVAWTRPTEELHVFLTGTDRTSARPGMSKALAALTEIFSFSGAVYEAGHIADATTRECPPSSTRPPTTAVNPPNDSASWRPMEWLPRLRIFRNPMEGTSFTERQRGMLAHACLEALRLSGDAKGDAERAVRHAMQSFPLPLPNPEHITREMTEILTWYAQLPTTGAWLRRGSREQTLMGTDGKLFRVDLLVDEGDLGLLTIEYKTGRPHAAHTTQLQGYLHLLSQASGRDVRGMLVYLDEQRLEEVPLRNNI